MKCAARQTLLEHTVNKTDTRTHSNVKKGNARTKHRSLPIGVEKSAQFYQHDFRTVPGRSQSVGVGAAPSVKPRSDLCSVVASSRYSGNAKFICLCFPHTLRGRSVKHWKIAPSLDWMETRWSVRTKNSFTPSIGNPVQSRTLLHTFVVLSIF